MQLSSDQMPRGVCDLFFFKSAVLSPPLVALRCLYVWGGTEQLLFRTDLGSVGLKGHSQSECDSFTLERKLPTHDNWPCRHQRLDHCSFTLENVDRLNSCPSLT